MSVTLEKIVNLCKRRGIIFPGSEIYGGLQNSYDFGLLGLEMANNIKQLWWKMFVQGRDDITGLQSPIIMNTKVWEASGHLKNFNDALIECKKCHSRFRADDLGAKTCPNCKGKKFTDVKSFNTMFATNLGPVEATENKVYLRPETAQAMFVDFSTIVDTTKMRVPFGIAQIGKAFRNEITPGNFIFRTREFEQMEIEYFIREEDWEDQFDYWLGEMKKWIKSVGIDESKIKYVEISDGERAHYSKRTIDVEFEWPFGQKELYGLAYRTDFDLKAHGVEYRDPETGEKFVPHVIEPTMGVDRTVLAVMLSCYEEVKGGRSTTTDSVKEEEIVLRLPKAIAPIKAAVLPLSRKDELVTPAKEIAKNLRKHWMIQYDETGSIGKRYRRQDEIGTPYCVTVDFDSLTDKKVTVRDRDTMEQERVAIEELTEYIGEKLKA